MFVAAETRKHFNVRFTVIAFIALLLINGIVVYRQACKTDEERLTDGKTLSLIYDEYRNDAESIEEYYSELQNYKKSQAKTKKTTEANGFEFVETRTSVWTDGLYTDDIEIISELKKYSQKQAGYPDEVQIYIQNARQNQKEFLREGYSADDYEVKYQKKAELLYSKVSENVSLSTVFINGWNDLYSFSLTGILCCAFAIILGTVTFTYEKDSGMYYLLRYTKKGRSTTAVSKLLSSFLIAILATVVLNAETVFIFAMKEGFSGGTEPIQAIETFRKSYLLCSVKEYLIFFVSQRILAALTFVSVSVLVSVLFYNYVLSYAVSFAFAGINIFLYSIGNEISQAPVRYINLYSLTEGTRLFTRYCAANIFENAISFPATACALFFVIIVATSSGSILIWSRGGAGIQIHFLSVLMSVIRNKAVRLKLFFESLSAKFGSGCTLSLNRHEFGKVFSGTLLPLLLIILFILSPFVFSKHEIFSEKKTYTDKLLNLYLEEYEGEWTEEKHQEIQDKLDDLNDIISNYGAMSIKHNSGQISDSEYSAYMIEYNNAIRDKSATELILTRSEYLKNKYEEEGIKGWFIVDDGWDLLFSRSSNWGAYISILISAITLVIAEYGSKPFSVILHTTKKGRRTVFVKKIAVSLIMGILFCLVFEIPEYIIIMKKIGLNSFLAPAISCTDCSGLNLNISLLGLLTVFLFVRIAACTVLALLTVTITALCRKAIPAMSVTAGVTLLPALCDFTGIKQAAYMDFLRYFEAGRLMFCSIERENANDFSLLIAVVLLSLVMCLALIVASGNRFCRKS